MQKNIGRIIGHVNMKVSLMLANVEIYEGDNLISVGEYKLSKEITFKEKLEEYIKCDLMVKYI